MSVLQSRHIVLHCCHAGDVEPVFMRELGGIPGIGLALGADVFIAPVTEVGSLTAVMLQNELFRAIERDEVGASYLRAIDRDRAVSLYNLYGTPYCSLALPANSATVSSDKAAA